MGKTALLQKFASNRRAIFHTAIGAPAVDELARLSVAAQASRHTMRDLAARPFVDWVDALEHLADAATEPLLLILDEFPELVEASPTLPNIMRGLWDRMRSNGNLKILLCGSAVRFMTAIQEARAPLYGRMDLALRLDPFQPHEAALMLRRLPPADRAAVWGLVGGMPMYLDAWDQGQSIRHNVSRLFCSPGGFLCNEGELVLATEAAGEGLGRAVLMAIGAGRTKHSEIKDAVRAEPSRMLDRLIELRLIERIVPVTEDPGRARNRSYRIADNFLAVWLGIINPHRAEIERGLGETILPVVMRSLDDHMGSRWEEAFRMHLRRMAGAGELGEDIVAVGPYWTRAQGSVEIDAVVLAGRGREVVAVGEAKWARSVNAGALRRDLERKAQSLPRRVEPLRYIICGRERVNGLGTGTIGLTAADLFDNAAR